MRLSRRSRRASLLGALTLMSSLAGVGIASADTWPISRHDAARTGTSTGVCPIEQPLVTWRAFMGGKPTARTGRFGGLGTSSLYVAAVGGRFVAKDVITQATLWTSPILGVGYVEAIDDLDGNAASEVVVRTETQVHVLDGKSGAVLWSSPAGKFRTPAAARVVDLNGDSRPDIYIDECTGCAKPGTMSAGAYSFSGGFAAPTTLWERSATTTPPPYNIGSDTIVDLDGNGLPEVVLTSAQEVVVVRGSDGTTIATLSAPDAPGKPFAQARAVAAELDGLPGKELLMVELDGQVSSQQGPAGVTAFKLDPKTGQSSFLYRRVASSYEARMVDLLDVAGDLDGDGIDEVILSYQSPGAGFTTEILGGAGGSVLATLPGARFEGLAGSKLVFASADGLALHEWKQGELGLVAGPLPGLRAASVPDLGAWSRGPLDRRLALLPRPGKTAALVVGTPSTDVPYAELPDVTSFVELEAYALGPAGLTPVGKHKPMVGAITGIMIADHATRPYPQLAVGTSSGAVVVLDLGSGGTISEA